MIGFIASRLNCRQTCFAPRGISIGECRGARAKTRRNVKPWLSALPAGAVFGCPWDPANALLFSREGIKSQSQTAGEKGKTSPHHRETKSKKTTESGSQDEVWRRGRGCVVPAPDRPASVSGNLCVSAVVDWLLRQSEKISEVILGPRRVPNRVTSRRCGERSFHGSCMDARKVSHVSSLNSPEESVVLAGLSRSVRSQF